jgi:hypothetical protein
VAETGRLRGEEGMGLGGSRGGLKETWWGCLLGEVERACVWCYIRWLGVLESWVVVARVPEWAVKVF